MTMLLFSLLFLSLFFDVLRIDIFTFPISPWPSRFLVPRRRMESMSLSVMSMARCVKGIGIHKTRRESYISCCSLPFHFCLSSLGLFLSFKIIIIDTLSLGRSLHGASVRHEEASRFFLWRVYCLYVEWQTLGG